METLTKAGILITVTIGAITTAFALVSYLRQGSPFIFDPSLWSLELLPPPSPTAFYSGMGFLIGLGIVMIVAGILLDVKRKPKES